MEGEEDQALGWVPTEGRGSLPFALVHGESLVAAASWAVGEAEVQLFDASVEFDQLRDAGRPLLLHDPLCPLTPAAFLAEAVALCRATGAVVVGWRPVTDTVKQSEGDELGATVDRTSLRAVTSPVVIPAEVLSRLPSLETDDLALLVRRLAAIAEVRWIEAPALGARISSAEDLAVLEALSRAEEGPRP